MRSPLSRVATTLLISVLVVACAPAASSAPTVTPRPTGPPASFLASAAPSFITTPEPPTTPAPSRAASGWPYTIVGDSEPVLGPDGTVYHLAGDARGNFRRSVVALDTAGHVKPGWPIEASPDTVFGSLAVGADGSVYTDECGDAEIGCVLHRLGADGRDMTGWPFEVPADFACPAPDPCYLSILGMEPGGTAYLTSSRAGNLQVLALDPLGRTMPGWPIVLDDYDWSDPQLGPDGTLYAIRRPTGTPTSDPSLGVIDEDAQLWAFGSNGKPRSGWPVPVPNIRRYLISPAGDVVTWSLINDIGELCNNPRRTVFSVLGPDGRTRPGWPRGSTGFASFPAVGDDGTLYYVSATHKVYAHDRTGEIKNGWPVAAPGAANLCGPATPYLAPDGTIYVAGDEFSALSPDGLALSGWPYRPTSQVSAPCFDTECFGGPAVGGPIAPDGTAYVVAYQTDPSGIRAEVVAIDRQGRLKAGWPFRVPFDANTVALGVHAVSRDDHVFLRGGDQLLALDPDGRISD